MTKAHFVIAKSRVSSVFALVEGLDRLAVLRWGMYAL